MIGEFVACLLCVVLACKCICEVLGCLWVRGLPGKGLHQDGAFGKTVGVVYACA